VSGPGDSEAGDVSDETDNLPAIPEHREIESADTRETTDLTSAVAARRPRRRVGNRGTGFLLGVFLLAAGFLGGIYAQRHWGAPTAATPEPGEVAANGTVTSLHDRTLTVRTAAGAEVKVVLDGGTRVEQATTLSELDPGSPVIVRGITRADGLIVATVITAS
jgi:hypothetical protein